VFVIVGDKLLRVAEQIALTDEQVLRLRAYGRGRKVERRLAERANIILLAAEGLENLDIAARLSIGRHTVARWRKRFLALGVNGIERDAPRPGRTRTLNADEIVRKTTQEKPANATHWSTRSMARAAGVSEASVRRVWHANGLKPHRVETFKFSNDPQFAEKLEDVVGLYLNPPEHAIVLSVDEKSQIQALDLT
jgi:transposase